MILWVVALRPEAAPLIEARRLVAASEPTPWPLYLRERDEALVITGVGRSSAAAACGWLYGHLGSAPRSAWLNVGIAGHSSGPVGRVLVAHRVVEPATGKTWYPPPLPGHGLPSETLFTVDRPETEFGEPGAYDMEASGFLAAAGRCTTAELVQVAKVISDSPTAPAHQLDRGRIRGLIEARMAEVATLAEALVQSVSILAARSALPPGYEALAGRWRFTVTQQRQLRRLLERYAALSPTGGRPPSIDAPDARGALRHLTQRVEALGVGA